MALFYPVRRARRPTSRRLQARGRAAARDNDLRRSFDCCNKIVEPQEYFLAGELVRLAWIGQSDDDIRESKAAAQIERGAPVQLGGERVAGGLAAAAAPGPRMTTPAVASFR